MKYTVITLSNEGKTISLRTEDQSYHISGAFRINTAALTAFLSDNEGAYYDFDEDFSLRLYRISDSSVSVHLTWLNDGCNAYSQNFILPVMMLCRVLAGKVVNAVTDNNFSYYDPGVAHELFGMKMPVFKAYCF